MSLGLPEGVRPRLLWKMRETMATLIQEKRKKKQKPVAWRGKISVEANIVSRNRPENRVEVLDEYKGAHLRTFRVLGYHQIEESRFLRTANVSKLEVVVVVFTQYF